MALSLYAGLSLCFAALALAALSATISGIWHRDWAYAGGALLVALIFAGGSLHLYEKSQEHLQRREAAGTGTVT